MKNKLLLIDHHDNLRDDLASVYLHKMGFNLELCRPFMGESLPVPENCIGAVIYGGAQNVAEQKQYPFLTDELHWIERALTCDIPILGICLGAQMIAHCLGAQVSGHDKGLCEFGYYEVFPTDHGKSLFPSSMYVVQAHYQQFALPARTTLLAGGNNFLNQAFRFDHHVYGVQFHPEVSAEIFRRWQDSDWAFYGLPGAQSRAEQDKILPHADPIQKEWFLQFLQGIFTPDSKKR